MNIEQATPAQREAIETDAECVLCVAGPGSGKTATLVARITRLMNAGISPYNMAVVTFTNAASREIEERLCNGTPARESISFGHIGTLHSLALKMLKEHGPALGYDEGIAVVSPESARDLLESKAQSLGCKAPMKELLAIKAKGRPAISRIGNTPEIVVASYFDDMKAAGVVDYDILLSEFLRLLTSMDATSCAAQLDIEDEFTHLFVDEVQDASPQDWDIYANFPAQWHFFVGDSDQAIFGWRGGSVANMVALAADTKTKVIKLEENFRSRSEICAAAQRLIAHNGSRVDKVTRSVSGSGGVILASEIPLHINEGEEIAAVSRMIRNCLEGPAVYSMAVIARTNHIARSFQATLKATGIPVVERTQSELPRDWALCRAFVELLAQPENDTLAFFYLISSLAAAGSKYARREAHAVRKCAAEAGKSVNAYSLGLTRVTRPASVLQALQGQGISRESQMIAAERLRELPVGASVQDYALSLGEVREQVTEAEGEGVHCLTIHAAKGREFDVVFLVGVEDEVIPGRRAGTDLEEERRLCYVAMTRAKKELYITGAASRVTAWKQTVAHTPSRFISEMGNR